MACICFIKYGEVHLGVDPLKANTWHCLSCGASDSEVFRVQQEYADAYSRGEEVEYLKGLLATPEAYVAPGTLAAMLGAK